MMLFKSSALLKKTLARLMVHDILISLPQFQGSLLLLQSLIKKEEINILDIQVSQITHLALTENEGFFLKGPDIIYISSLFLVWKTRKLLPKQEEVSLIDDEDEGLFEQFIQESEFKQIVEDLWHLEQKRLPFFARDVQFFPEKEQPNYEDVQLDELAQLFQQLMDKAPFAEMDVEEEFNLSSRLTYLEDELQKRQELNFEELFSPSKNKGELIALFLALLELMKMQKVHVLRREQDNQVALIISLN